MGFPGSVKTKLSLHPSVILWLSVLGYLHPRIVLPFAVSVLLHEGGHYLCLRAMGHPPQMVTFSLSGARMEVSELSYRQELLCAASGPVVSLLLGLCLPLWPMLGGYSLCLGLINLLPLGSLDGGRMLRCGLLLLLPQRQALTIFRLINVVIGCLLLLPGLYCCVYGHMGLLPLLICGALLYKALTAGVL